MVCTAHKGENYFRRNIALYVSRFRWGGEGYTKTTVGFALIASTLSIFLVGRGLVCWYWKIDRVVALPEAIERRLKGLDAKDLRPINKVDALTQRQQS